MTFDLTDEETQALLKELDDIIDGDRYQFSARVARAAATAETVRPAAGDRSEEAALGGRRAAVSVITVVLARCCVS